MSQSPQLLQIKIFCCPEFGCRKKFEKIRGLNIHLKMRHKSDYQIEVIDGSTTITGRR